MGISRKGRRMKGVLNVSGNDVFNWYSLSARAMPVFIPLGACLVSNYAMADALPPPSTPTTVNSTINTGYPSGQKLTQMGYNPQTGTLTISNNGNATVTKTGDTITGTQGKTISATGRYGETGKINTTVTQGVSAKALGVAAAASWADSAYSGTSASAYLEEARNSAAKGNYFDAAYNAAKAAGEGVKSLIPFGGAIGDALGSSNNSDYAKMAETAKGVYDAAKGQGSSDGQALGEAAAAANAAKGAAMARGDFGGAAAAAAAAKGATAASNAASINGALDNPPKDDSGRRLYPGIYTFTEKNQRDPNDMTYVTQVQGYAYAPGINAGNNISKSQGQTGSYNIWAPNIHLLSSPPTYTAKNENSTLITWSFQSYGVKVQLKEEDLTLNQSEVEEILKQMLANQNANHQALMNQLAGMAAAGSTTVNNTTITNNNGNATGQSVVDAATTSHTNTGGTALSEPYTPAGTSQAQQTKWTLNPDGTITAETVARPDLQANSSQAPARSEQTNTGQTGQNTVNNPSSTGQQPSQQQQEQNQCTLTPNAAMCQELGEEDGDIQLGEKTIDLNFSPADIFSTDGECPAPKQVNLGMLGTISFTYEYICYFARLIRPIFILGAMVVTAFFVWEAVGNQS